jgi:hypothetical protein
MVVVSSVVEVAGQAEVSGAGFVVCEIEQVFVPDWLFADSTRLAGRPLSKLAFPFCDVCLAVAALLATAARSVVCAFAGRAA